MKQQVPISEKYVLSTEEASCYFGIGINKLRKIINENQNAEWVLWNGGHAQVKRKLFERFIDAQNAI